MNTLISAIIVNYNAGNLLRECVASLLACPLDMEIIVVDNASADGSLEALNDLPEINIIRNSKNLGFSAACNIGIKASGGRYKLFLNPDCSFVPGSISRLLNCLQSNEQAGMVGGVLVNPDGSEQAGARRSVPTPWRSFVRAFGLTRFRNRWPRLFNDFYLHQQPMPDQPIEVEAISGACMLVKNEAIDDVGLWDEGYFLHCEDLDWCMRFRQKSWKILFDPSVKIVHALGVCGEGRPVFVEWHKHKGMMRFYRKFFRHQYPLPLMMLVFIGVWLRFALVFGCLIGKRIVNRLGLRNG
ncbi:glycosyltransferase family 2 protein [Methylomarinum sp. Ch1-1]|uniref:Glycosyltransferase family 2 protein n=1 Tax=Methylomarinum roseum TaxID=3067653 RepID=A0AAU7NVV5_9GAMM|nr:glycosyltransferase family 2 protein [Methylomarinum sp. Ch1-1]MDP4522855.1 glycosyltransferase family 2 protein [Methylomarinum sp. Ch1-1]